MMATNNEMQVGSQNVCLDEDYGRCKPESISEHSSLGRIVRCTYKATVGRVLTHQRSRVRFDSVQASRRAPGGLVWLNRSAPNGLDSTMAQTEVHASGIGWEGG